jgi:preprotein translocase subunit SecG
MDKKIIASKISNVLTIFSVILSILLVAQGILLHNGNKNLSDKCNYNFFDKISCFEIVENRNTDNYINNSLPHFEYSEDILNRGKK